MLVIKNAGYKIKCKVNQQSDSNKYSTTYWYVKTCFEMSY